MYDYGRNNSWEIFTVSFFGHRIIERPFEAERSLEQIVRRLLTEKPYGEFLVGRDGDYDLLVASVIKRVNSAVRSDNSALVWVAVHDGKTPME